MLVSGRRNAVAPPSPAGGRVQHRLGGVDRVVAGGGSPRTTTSRSDGRRRVDGKAGILQLREVGGRGHDAGGLRDAFARAQRGAQLHQRHRILVEIREHLERHGRHCALRGAREPTPSNRKAESGEAGDHVRSGRRPAVERAGSAAARTALVGLAQKRIAEANGVGIEVAPCRDAQEMRRDRRGPERSRHRSRPEISRRNVPPVRAASASPKSAAQQPDQDIVARRGQAFAPTDQPREIPRASRGRGGGKTRRVRRASTDLRDR